MKTLLIILITLPFSVQAQKLYSFENYPELLQEAISRDIHKPTPDFITEVEIPSSEVSPKFIAQLIFDKVKYSLKPNGILTKVLIDYKDVLMSHQVYRNTYLHMLGMRLVHYSRSDKCDFTREILKPKESEGFKERSELLRSDKLYWLNYASSNLQRGRNIDEGLAELSKFCATTEKNDSKIKSLLYKYGLITYSKIVTVPSDPKIISLEEVLKYNFFNTET